MKPLKVFAKSAEEAIVKIRETAEKEKRGALYIIVRRHFWWLLWTCLCGCVAWLAQRPGTALVMAAVPLALLVAVRLMRTAVGLVALTALLAWAIFTAACQAPKVHHFLDLTTYKFVTGSEAIVIPYSGDVVRLYAQDDFYIGDHLKKVGQNVTPGERILVADMSREVGKLAEMEQAVRPQAAYAEYLLSQNRRKMEEARIRAKLSAAKQRQLAFERAQFEKPSRQGQSLLATYRKLVEKGLMSQQEFAGIEKEYERLKSEQEQIGWEMKLLALDVDRPEGTEVFQKQHEFESARVELLKYRTESQREWLRNVAFVTAPNGESYASLSELLREPEDAGDGRRSKPVRGPAAPFPGDPGLATAPNGSLMTLASNGYLGHRPDERPDSVPWLNRRSKGDKAAVERTWSEGELIYLAGSRSSSQVKRGELVAEIWTGQKRKRIGISIPRSKMVGINLGTPVNFLLDEEVGDFDSVVYGKVKKIRQYPDRDTFWLEAGDLKVMGGERELEEFPIGLSGNYRIGLRSISHKEKYLKVKGEAASLKDIWSSVWQHLVAYTRHVAGEDFIAEPPTQDGEPESRPPSEEVPLENVFFAPIARR